MNSYRRVIIATMNLTADEVREECNVTTILDREVTDLLKAFRSQILDAGRSGHTATVVPVPTNFNVPHMDNKDAQIIIYHRLIEEIEESGFSVRVNLEIPLTFEVRWDVKKDNSDLTRMKQNIYSHSIQQQKKESKRKAIKQKKLTEEQRAAQMNARLYKAKHGL